MITSTYGDGEPPDNAKALHTALASAEGSSLEIAPILKSQIWQPSTLSAVRYSILRPRRHQLRPVLPVPASRLSTLWLEKLGATRVALPRTDCDLDYDAPFTAWLDCRAEFALASANCGRELYARDVAPHEVGA